MKQLILATILLVAAIGAYADMQIDLTEARQQLVAIDSYGRETHIVDRMRSDSRIIEFVTERLKMRIEELQNAQARVANLPAGSTGVWFFGETQTFLTSETITPGQARGLYGVMFVFCDGTVLHAELGCKGNAILFYGTAPNKPVAPVVIEKTTIVQGTPGATGAPGVPGCDGKDGRNGYNGRDGRDGCDGRDGANFFYITYQQPQQAMCGTYAAPSSYLQVNSPGASGLGGFSYSYSGGTAISVVSSAKGGSATGGNATGGSATGGQGGQGGAGGSSTSNNSDTNVVTPVNNNTINTGDHGSATGTATGTGQGTSNSGNK
jgi:hypothetical protein